MSTAAQIWQTHQNQVQIQQLAALNWQLQQQQQQAAYQANLGQALFETERVARRVAATMPHDPFASAVVATSWLRGVGGINAAMFTDLHAKRSWDEAFRCLDGAARAGRNDERMAADIDRYFASLEKLAAFRSQLGDDPARLIAQQRAAFEGISVEPLKIVTIAAGAVTALFTLVVLFAKDAPGGLIILGLIGLVICWSQWSGARRRRELAAQALAHTEATATAYDAFMRAAEGGGWVHETWKAHPYLFAEPPPQAPTAVSNTAVQTYVERKVVERQVVVVRCRFCKQLTPVDQEACAHCGAPGFGSSQD